MKKFIIYYFLFLSSFFVFLSSGVIDSQDGFQYVEVARNIYYTGHPTGPIYKYDTRENIFMATHLGKDGRTYSNVGLGFSLAMIPAVAVTDLVYKVYNVSPPVNFPLQNDWLILLTTSFTNSFFGALLGVTLLLYLLELGLTRKQSLLISFAGIMGTNLFIYTRHAFAHMMFTSFLFLAFYLIRKHFKTGRFQYLFLAGLSYGVMIITYNQTFVLTAIPSLAYFLILSKLKPAHVLNRKFLNQIKPLIIKLTIFFLATAPFFLIYTWFENLRAAAGSNLSSPVALATRGFNPLRSLPFGVFIEGLYGQLFSPGRSIFLYSPAILLVIIFWQKIKKSVFAELAVFISMSAIFIIFYATQFSIGSPEQGIAGLWHGESSWGPRYLLPLIPFGLLIAGFIYTRLNKAQKLLIVMPLFLAGFYVEILGSVMPYQIKYHDLQDKFFVNSTEFTNFAYGNLIPRFSPVFMMSKNLVKLARSLPKTLSHGSYNVRFYDGIDFPFPVGVERWRVVDQKGDISFDNVNSDPVKNISFGLINHPIEEASYSAKVRASLNGNFLKEENYLPKERKIMDLEIPRRLLQAEDNQLLLDIEFRSLENGRTLIKSGQYKDDPASYANKTLQPNKSVSQILGIISMQINGKEVNKESLDFPYVSNLGPVMTGKKYLTYGSLNSDPWKSWDIHTQIYERVPDFWWAKFLYYWDIPKLPLFLFFLMIVVLMIVSGGKTLRNLNNK